MRGVAAEPCQADDAIARRDRGDALANGFDRAGKLEPGHERAFRCGGVEAEARGDLGEVEPDGRDGHAGLARRRGFQLL